MKKAAIFLEGQTELIFVRKLLEELAGSNHIVFHEQRRQSGSFIVLSSDPVNGEQYFVLLVDCCGDHAVASTIRDNHSSLTRQGYDLILGLRDLFPFEHHELENLINGQNSVLPTTGTPCFIAVAVAEVEAWFIQDNTHFERIHPNLTHPNILNSIGYDIEADAAENLPHPVNKLKEIYALERKRYTKKRRSVSAVVNKIDYDHLYLDRRSMMPSFNFFVSRIEEFLS